jgi:hypothetical protein
MRYSYGTSVASKFDLKKREIDLSFKSESSLALAEGKIEGNFYWPDADGAEVTFADTPTRGSRAGQEIECNIGVFRFKATAELAGFAGASLQASAGLTFGMKEGKVKMRGSVKQSDNKDENYVGVGGEAFAGIKGTGSVSGAGEWQNPEKGHDWVALVKLGVSATAAAGLSLEGSFAIRYIDGRFVVHFSGQAVAGVGGGGKFACTVGVKHIGSFLTYIYHQLKNEDFHFAGVIATKAFDYYVTYSTYGLVTGEDVREMYEKGKQSFRTMAKAINHKLEIMQSNVDEQQRLEKLAEHIISNKQNLTCQPPETKGQILYSLTPRFWISFEEKQEEAIIAILKTAQTWNDYVEIVSHCSSGGQKIPQEEGEKRLWKILDGKERNQFELLRYQLHKLPRQPQIKTAAIQDNGLTLTA